MSDLADQSTTPPGSGSLETDLRAQAESVLAALTDPRIGRTLQALVAAATSDADTARALRQFHTRRITEWSKHIERAIEDGELPPGTDPEEVTRAIAAPLYYRQMVTREPIDEAVAHRCVAAALAAARAGAFVTAATAT